MRHAADRWVALLAVVMASALAQALPVWAAGPAVEFTSPQGDDQGRYVPPSTLRGVTLWGLVSGRHTVHTVTVNDFEARLLPTDRQALGAREGMSTVAFKAYLNLGPGTVVKVRVAAEDGNTTETVFVPDGPGVVASLRALTEKTPKSAEAWCRLANARRDQGGFTAAIDLYQKTCKLDSKLVAAQVGLGQALYLYSIPKPAAGQYAGGPVQAEDYGPHFYLGTSVCAETDALQTQVARRGLQRVALGRAIAAFRRAIALDPKSFEAEFGLGLALSDQMRVDEATAAYRSAVAIDPGDFEAHFRLGCLLRRADLRDEAIAKQRKSIELRPIFGPSHYCLARALYVKGDYAGAWEEVHLARKYGVAASSSFLHALRGKMPEPTR